MIACEAATAIAELDLGTKPRVVNGLPLLYASTGVSVKILWLNVKNAAVD
jgi:hypothetical protein